MGGNYFSAVLPGRTSIPVIYIWQTESSVCQCILWILLTDGKSKAAMAIRQVTLPPFFQVSQSIPPWVSDLGPFTSSGLEFSNPLALRQGFGVQPSEDHPWLPGLDPARGSLWQQLVSDSETTSSETKHMFFYHKYKGCRAKLIKKVESANPYSFIKA